MSACDMEVLLVRPKRACEMLSIGQTRLFELLNANELQSFKDGGGRWISVASIRAYVERQLERARAASTAELDAARQADRAPMA